MKKDGNRDGNRAKLCNGMFSEYDKNLCLIFRCVFRNRCYLPGAAAQSRQTKSRALGQISRKTARRVSGEQLPVLQGTVAVSFSVPRRGRPTACQRAHAGRYLFSSHFSVPPFQFPLQFRFRVLPAVIVRPRRLGRAQRTVKGQSGANWELELGTRIEPAPGTEEAISRPKLFLPELSGNLLLRFLPASPETQYLRCLVPATPAQ